MEIKKVVISFPDVKLNQRDAHKLRGYIGNVFKEHSTLLHNHFDDGQLRYNYPLVQFKVINKNPYIIALAEGCDVLIDLFMKIKELRIDEIVIEIYSKNISCDKEIIKMSERMVDYEFITGWFALNQDNFNEFIKIKKQAQQTDLLKKILTSNILSFNKSLRNWIENKIYVSIDVKKTKTKFKEKEMFIFNGKFSANIILPDYIGLGKSVSRGFGTIKKVV